MEGSYYGAVSQSGDKGLHAITHLIPRLCRKGESQNPEIPVPRRIQNPRDPRGQYRRFPDARTGKHKTRALTPLGSPTLGRTKAIHRGGEFWRHAAPSRRVVMTFTNACGIRSARPRS